LHLSLARRESLDIEGRRMKLRSQLPARGTPCDIRDAMFTFDAL
jgi:hypothetical protein